MTGLNSLIKALIPQKWHYTYVAHSRKHLSQFGQDFWVFGEVFNEKKNGFFVDIGSADGITINNTFLLEAKYKWRGICIEANPASFATLKKNRRSTCLNICVDSQEGSVSFYNDGLTSGIISAETDNSQQHSIDSKNIVVLETKTLEAVLDLHQSPTTIDYLSIDVEGAEERVLGEFPFDKYKFNCITIERPSLKLRKTLAANRYLLIREIRGVDVFYIHEDFLESYSINLIDFWKKNKK